MTKPQMKSLPISKLHVSKLNMRYGRKKPDVSDLLPSIRSRGVRQSLLVRPEGDGFGVVAGRRRLHVLTLLAEESGKEQFAPVLLMNEGDDAEAIEASLAENIAREPATEMEQFEAFTRLHKEGRTVEDIAEQFGVSELKVRRILALGALHKKIRALYAADEIDVSTIRALTLATKAQQAEWVRLWKSEREKPPLGRLCREWVTGGTTITTDKALFELDDYAGKVIGDLFGEAAVFEDSDAFWTAQSAAIAARAEDYREAGWRDVHVLDRGVYFHSWEYAERPKSKGGRVIVEVRHDGTVTFHEGFVTPAENSRLDAPEGTKPAKADKPELSGPLAEYVSLHRLEVVKADLGQNLHTSLCLMVAHAITGSRTWDMRNCHPTIRKDATEASVNNSPAAAKVDAARNEVKALLQAAGLAEPFTRQGSWKPELIGQVFTALLSLDADAVLRVASVVMAYTLANDPVVVEAAGLAMESDFEAGWTPDEALFELIRDKATLSEMVAEVASPATAIEMGKESGKTLKAFVAGRLVDSADHKADTTWRPRWMHNVPSSYGVGVNTIADGHAEAAALFEPVTDEADDASESS